jgi:hypothetical protein
LKEGVSFADDGGFTPGAVKLQRSVDPHGWHMAFRDYVSTAGATPTGWASPRIGVSAEQACHLPLAPLPSERRETLTNQLRREQAEAQDPPVLVGQDATSAAPLD